VLERQSDMKASKKGLVATAGSLLSGLTLLAISQPAQAFTFYTGSALDGTAAPPTGAALTARNNFDTAAGLLGTVATDGFESADNTFYDTGTGTLTRTGFTLLVTNGQTGQTDNGLNNTNTANATGHNTTAGGTGLVRIGQPTGTAPPQTSATFTFGVPLKAFGLYITDYGNTALAGTALNVTVNGGATVSGFPQLIPKLNPGGNTNRSVQFFGFTQQAGDPLIASITFQFSGLTTQIDRLALDDVRFVQSTPVPVPPQLLGTVLAAGLGFWKTQRRKLKLKAKRA
jgi:hypothetical protein